MLGVIKPHYLQLEVYTMKLVELKNFLSKFPTVLLSRGRARDTGTILQSPRTTSQYCLWGSPESKHLEIPQLQTDKLAKLAARPKTCDQTSRGGFTRRKVEFPGYWQTRQAARWNCAKLWERLYYTGRCNYATTLYSTPFTEFAGIRNPCCYREPSVGPCEWQRWDRQRPL